MIEAVFEVTYNRDAPWLVGTEAYAAETSMAKARAAVLRDLGPGVRIKLIKEEEL